MKKGLRDQIDKLAAMNVAALQQRHEELFGDGPVSAHRQFLFRKIAWRMKQWTTRKGTVTGGQAFTKNRLYNLLTNMVYIGKVQYGGQAYEGEHAAIVDADIWQRVQDRLRFNSKTGGRQIRNKYGAVPKGILRYASCEAGMVHTYTQKAPNKLYRYYVCVNTHQKGYNQCPTRSVSAPVIEQAVVDQVRGIAANPDVVAEVVRQLDDQRVAGIEGLEREKRVMEKELQHLGEEIAGIVRMNGKLATDRMADLQQRVAVLERQLREVRDQLAESVGQTMDVASVRKILREFDGAWSEMTPRTGEVREDARRACLLRRSHRHSGGRCPDGSDQTALS